MGIQKFEDILSWQLGQELAQDVYRVFSRNADPDYRAQIRSAVVSISSNIAEGFERGTDADFVRMLYIAKGSAGEVRSLIHLAGSLGFIEQPEQSAFLEKCNRISALIAALIKSISNKGRGRDTAPLAG